MEVWSRDLWIPNGVTMAIVGIFAISVIQGLTRGASSSAKHLAMMVTEGAVTLLSLFLAWELTVWLSPFVRHWLETMTLGAPPAEQNFWQQMSYTVGTGMRDFSLLRFSVLFVLGYGAVKQIVYRIVDPLVNDWLAEQPAALARRARAVSVQRGPTLLSSFIGGVIGAVTGLGRGLMMIAVLFIIVSLLPQTPVATYIQASSLYQKGATEVIQPVTGDFLVTTLPVFTRQVEQEFSNILQRKYEVIDARISPDIAEAAKQVAGKGKTDEDKAKLLYRWVGTRVQYDWDKVKLYEEQRIWKEQTPQDTFDTKQGVCIDFSRLYAVMARSIGLDVKVVTGLGYDGKGAYGPHAWNEVYLSEKNAWVPLDTTWVATGMNWFNPPKFNETHIKDA